VKGFAKALYLAQTREKTMKLVILLLVVLGATVACSHYETTLRDPTNTQEVRCATQGWSLIGFIMASTAHDDCVAWYKARGYQEEGRRP